MYVERVLSSPFERRAKSNKAGVMLQTLTLIGLTTMFVCSWGTDCLRYCKAVRDGDRRLLGPLRLRIVGLFVGLPAVLAIISHPDWLRGRVWGWTIVAALLIGTTIALWGFLLEKSVTRKRPVPQVRPNTTDPK